MRDAWRSTYDSWKLRSDLDDAPPDEFDDYDAALDAWLSYDAAIAAKRARGDRHDWQRQNVLNSANDLEEGKPMGNADQPNDFAADLTNMIGRYLEAGTTPDELAAALQEAIEQLEGEAVNDAGDELVSDDEGKPDDDEMS